VLDRVLRHLRPDPDAHQLAHVGELHAALAAADALLGRTAAAVDADPAAEHGLAVATVRAAVERAAREVVDRAPRIVGPAPLSRDADLARALADLALYIRQHHAERDHAALGGQVVDRWRTA
jgi:alkylation response protein AidB-like acyl-CoA dehydrogenase